MSTLVDVDFSVVCPLCSTHDVSRLNLYKISDISAIYKSQLSINVDSELEGHSEISLYNCSNSGLKFFHPAICGSEKFYEDLQGYDWYYLEEKYEYNHALRFITTKDQVLEIGCGNGMFAQKLSVKKYIGLELSQKAQLSACQSGLHVLHETIQSHASSCHEAYDVVCSFQVLEHVSDLTSFIDASVHCLKPGGILIYSVPSEDSFLSLLRNNVLNMPPHHLTRWSDEALKFIAEIFNLELVEIQHEPLSEIHKKSFLSAIFLEGFNKQLGLNFSKLDRTIKYRIFSRLSDILSNFFVDIMNESFIWPHGHSVTVVYKKKYI